MALTRTERDPRGDDPSPCEEPAAIARKRRKAAMSRIWKQFRKNRWAWPAGDPDLLPPGGDLRAAPREPV